MAPALANKSEPPYVGSYILLVAANGRVYSALPINCGRFVGPNATFASASSVN